MSTKISSFNQQNLRELVAAAHEALAPVAKQFGLTLEKKSGSFATEEFTFKAIFKTPAAEKIAETKTLRFIGTVAGLPKDIIGKTFTAGKRDYKVLELKPNRPSYPVVASRVPDGRRFKFPVDMVVAGLK